MPLGVQYSGKWTLQSQAQAVAASTWPKAPNLWGWGNNGAGGLGLNNRTYYSSPKQIGSSTWLSISTNQPGFTLAVKNDNTLWAWGDGSLNGQLGLGNLTSYSSPKQVGALTNWSSVSTGWYFALAIKTDGTLWSWGKNNSSQLGLGVISTEYSSPKQVGSLTNWATIATGQYFSMATKTDGTIWGWGNNQVGQGGTGSTSTIGRSSPVQIGALANWSIVTAAGQFVMAIKTDGTLWAWGDNANGQLGLGNITSYSSPKQVGALTNWSKISANRYSISAIKTDGTLWAWGNNTNGQLGLGNVTYYSSPKQVGALTIWSSISGGLDSYFGITTSKALWAWGANSYGQLGLGNTTKYSSPKQVGALTSWLKISSGYGGQVFGIVQ